MSSHKRRTVPLSPERQAAAHLNRFFASESSLRRKTHPFRLEPQPVPGKISAKQRVQLTLIMAERHFRRQVKGRE
jgi:hypothetical protein